MSLHFLTNASPELHGIAAETIRDLAFAFRQPCAVCRKPIDAGDGDAPRNAHLRAHAKCTKPSTSTIPPAATSASLP